MFNINEFKARLDQVGGPAKSNMFVVEFSPAKTSSTFMTPEMLRFFCKTVTVPGINLQMAEYNPRNYGLTSPSPVGITSTPLNALFIMDDNHRVMSFFHEWMQKIINYDYTSDLFSSNRNSPRQHVYELNYKSDYAVGMKIKHFSTNTQRGFEPSAYECVLGGVYPTEVSPTTLSWEGGEVMALSVNFAYDRIVFSGNSPGNSINNSGMDYTTDYYNSIGSKGFTNT